MRGKTVQRASAVLQLALLCSLSALAQSPPFAQSPPISFSADIASLDAGGARLGEIAKLYATDRKTRIETLGASDGFFLSDTAAATALFVRSAQRIYLDARKSTPLTQIFMRVEARDPCGQWQAAAAIAGEPHTGEWHCEPIEHHLVNRHEIIEYRVSVPDRPSSYGWVDSTLGFPVKWQTSDGKLFALENIQLQAQPAGLFIVPPDYRKLDPQALLDRIKHSDVWVDSPK